MPRQKSVWFRTETQLVWLGLALGLGCANYQELNVTSSPADADVFLDQRRLGKTPLKLTVERTRDHALYVKKDGYTPELVVLTLRDAPDGRKFLTPADVFVTLTRGRSDGFDGSETGLPPAGDRGGADRNPAAAPRDSGKGEAAEPGDRDRDLKIRPGQPAPSPRRP